MRDGASFGMMRQNERSRDGNAAKGVLISLSNHIPQYSTEELKKILSEQSAIVIDVRTPEEYEEGHIPGVPLKPMQDVVDWMTDLEPTQSYVLVCRSGGRSQRVAEFLVQNGFQQVANYSGGMLGWDGELEV